MLGVLRVSKSSTSYFLKLIYKLSQRRFLMKFRRNLMCVGRYAAKVMRKERSEMEHNRSEMPAKVTKQICIPAGCDYAIKVQLMLSHSYGMQNINISIAGICPNKFERAKGSKRFHFSSLHYIFSAYLPTHIKSLRNLLQSSLITMITETICISFPIFLQFSCMNFGVYLQRETVK